MLLKNIADLLPGLDFNLLTAVDELLIEDFYAAVSGHVRRCGDTVWSGGGCGGGC